MLRRVLLLLLICSAGNNGAAVAQESGNEEYLWPTDASRYLTSSFGEYRARRFHMGTDIKTWGRVGYKCFAVRSGYVWRISVSPYGYGKALYVRLDTGETAVYAHLSKFTDEIQSLVEQEQQRKGRYRVNLFLKSNVLPVTQGDVIAYTGQTGIGAPHLHFEIRDAANRPINPLSKGYAIPDRVNPIIRAVSFTPLDSESEVNGDYRPVVVAAQWVREGEYVINEPITVWGNVGIGVKAHDKMLDVPHRFGVYSIRLMVDGVARFAYKYDHLTFDTNHLVELERDYRQSRRGRGRFYKLYKDKFNTKTYYEPNHEWAGVLTSASLETIPELSEENLLSKSGDRQAKGQLFPGVHDFTIEISDYFNNVSRLKGSIRVGAAFDIEPVLTVDSEGQLGLADVMTYDLTHLQELNGFILKGVNWRELPLQWAAMLPGREERGGRGQTEELQEPIVMPLNLNASQGGPVILKFEGRDQFGAASYPAYHMQVSGAERAKNAEINLSFDYYDDYVRLALTSQALLVKPPELILHPGTSNAMPLVVHQVNLKEYISRLPLAALQGHAHQIQINAQSLSGDTISLTEVLKAESVGPGNAVRVESDHGDFWVTFDRTSLYRPALIRVSADSSAIPGYASVGPIYTVEPKDILMRGGASVNLRYAEGTPNPAKLGVYYKSGSRWRFIDNKHDYTNRTVAAKVLSFEDFVLIRDETPPEMSRIRPRAGSHSTDHRPVISAHVMDRLSGIGSERDLELRLDGKQLIAEYDPERRHLSYQVKDPLTVGRHEVLVTAMDKSGNIAAASSFFWVE